MADVNIPDFKSVKNVISSLNTVNSSIDSALSNVRSSLSSVPSQISGDVSQKYSSLEELIKEVKNYCNTAVNNLYLSVNDYYTYENSENSEFDLDAISSDDFGLNGIDQDSFIGSESLLATLDLGTESILARLGLKGFGETGAELGGFANSEFSLDALSGGIKYGNTILFNDAGGRDTGYSRMLLTSHGKMIKVFQQLWNSKLQFSNSNQNLRRSGCGFTAVATILSAIDPNITPEEVFKKLKKKKMTAGAVQGYLQRDYGIRVDERDEVPRGSKEYISYLASNLMKGNMVLAVVKPGPDAKYTQNKHWVALVDYDPVTECVFVTDSNDEHDKNAAPIKLKDFINDYSINTNVVHIADYQG